MQASSWENHPSFPIFVANLVAGLTSTELQTVIKCGELLSLPDPVRYQSISIRTPDGGTTEFIDNWDPEWHASTLSGFYQFAFTDYQGGVHQSLLAVNAGDIYESQISPGQWMPASNFEKSLTEGESVSTMKLQPFLLLVALLLAILEARIAWR
jgi:hypothetical protein